MNWSDLAVLTQTGTGSASAAPAWVLASALAVGGLLSGVLGSVPYQSAPGTTGFVAPNTSSNKQFFTQTGTGSAGAAPAWAGIASGDLTTALTTPPAIGGATPAAGAFTTLSASGAKAPVGQRRTAGLAGTATHHAQIISGRASARCGCGRAEGRTRRGLCAPRRTVSRSTGACPGAVSGHARD